MDKIIDLKKAVDARKELSEKITTSGKPPHADYWCQSIYMADKAVKDAFTAMYEQGKGS